MHLNKLSIHLMYIIMMLFRLTAYDGCDRRGHDITELISQRNRQPRGSSMYSKVILHHRAAPCMVR